MIDNAAPNIVQDLRPIDAIFWEPGTNYDEMRVGYRGVTKILPYYEHGSQAYVPWFAVFKGDTVHCRCNAASLAGVVYREEG